VTTTPPARAALEYAMPFFIVSRLQDTLDFYTRQMGFATELAIPVGSPYFGIVVRDRVGIILKEIDEKTPPQPNHTRHGWARWDAYFHTAEPDLLFEEFRTKQITIVSPVGDTDDGLRAFEIKDNNGYVLCFGRPK
jgi:catechol 2,3-dioxygenase-like lactoylglutathione lyase family enzyme